MINWIKKNKEVLIPGVLILISMLIVGLVYVSQISYKKQIRQLDKSIAEKEKSIKGREVVIGELRKGISERDESIAERDELILAKDGEIKVIRKERDSWKGKVEEMTPSEVVIETRKVLNCANIFERLDGVLFSLECAKVNLRALNTGEFSLANEEVKKLNGKIADMVAKDVMKNAKITDLWAMIMEKDGVIADERGISKDWKDKFDLSEKKNKKARRKGRKEGTIIGGIIGGLIGYFLGR